MYFSLPPTSPALGCSVLSVDSSRLLGLWKGGHLEQERASVLVIAWEMAQPGWELMPEAKATSDVRAKALGLTVLFALCGRHMASLKFKLSAAGICWVFPTTFSGIARSDHCAWKLATELSGRHPCWWWTEYAKCLSPETAERVSQPYPIAHAAWLCLIRVPFWRWARDHIQIVELHLLVWFVLFSSRESNEILTFMAFPVLNIQWHSFFIYDVSSGHSGRLVGFLEVVSSVGFLPYEFFFLPYLSVEISYVRCTFWSIGVLVGESDTET